MFKNFLAIFNFFSPAIKNIYKYTQLINSLLYLIKKLDSEVLAAAERAKHT